MGKKKDKYSNFSELQARERKDIDFRITTYFHNPLTTAVVAPHGGAIEPGTSELALAIASIDLNAAIFEGIKPHGNYSSLHITSTKFDEPRCFSVVEQSSAVLALHGENSDGKVVYIGGIDNTLRKAISNALTTDGFEVCIHKDNYLQGLSPHNICNRGNRKKGVQLELAKGLRATFFSDLTWKGRKSQTAEFKKFVEAVRRGLLDGGAL